jgi:hypothetical protein
VAVDADTNYRYLGTGSPMALEVSGPSAEACIACAVEGFTAAYADVHPSVVPADRGFVLGGDTPVDLLRAVLDASVSLTVDGDLAVSASGLHVVGDKIEGSFDAVPAVWAALAVSLPVSVSWHDLSLVRSNGHWVARVVAELS